MLAVFKKVETDDKEKIKEMLLEFKEGNQGIILDGLFAFLSDMCENSPRPIVLMIDEVDSASNNQVFIDFLAQMRGYYLKRDETPTFHSVILAGVYRLKNIHFLTGKFAQAANRIFETQLYNYFLSEEELSEANSANQIGDVAKRDRSYFIHDGMLDMDTVMRRFVVSFTDLYGAKDARFVEEYGRKFFLLYLRPIINGTGNYYVEARTRDERRTDVIVDYLGEQFIIKLKIWRVNEYNERGEKQLADYLEYYHKDKGYLLSFNFNQNKETGVKEIQVGDKIIVEAVV